jgi:MraZ protein
LAGVGVYFGEDLHTMDAKGRINIPARHRRTALRRGDRLWLMPGFEDCLVMLDEEAFSAYAERVRNLPGNAEEARRFERTLFRRTVDLEPDEQGRVVIPEPLRRYAGLERAVLLLGVNNRVELWNPDRYSSYEASSPQSMAEVARRLLI